MRFLIDGYNLMHALGLARPRGPGQLARSRADLIDWLVKIHAPDADSVDVVFDGRINPGQFDSDQNDRGIHISFSVGRIADDLIEEMIERERDPRRMTVVSSDRRIRDSARHRDCIAWSCDEYLDWSANRGHEATKSTPPADKPESASSAEREHWKKEFADLDADPKLREFNKPFEDFYQ